MSSLTGKQLDVVGAQTHRRPRGLYLFKVDSLAAKQRSWLDETKRETISLNAAKMADLASPGNSQWRKETKTSEHHRLHQKQISAK